MCFADRASKMTALGFNFLWRMTCSMKIGWVQVVKALWEYIKANDLQDPANKRKINVDEKLATLFTKPLGNAQPKDSIPVSPIGASYILQP